MNRVKTEIQKYLDSCGLPFQVLSDTTILVQSPSGVAIVDCNVIAKAISIDSSSLSIADLVNAQIGAPKLGESLVENVDLSHDDDAVISTYVPVGRHVKPKPIPPTPSWWSVDYFTQDGFLIDAACNPIGPGRGLFIGKYGLSYFDSLKTFADFTGKFSGCAQSWYESRDLDQLRSDMAPFPYDAGVPADWNPTVEHDRQLHETMIANDSKLLTDFIDDLCINECLVGGTEWPDGTYDFALIGKCDGYWLDLFVGDR